jgi:L-fuconolactonase
MRIDAHQHFWQFDPVRDAWINEDMQAIRRNFMPQDLWPTLQQHGFDGCVVVQSDQQEEENTFQLSNAAGNPFIKGVVGWTNLMDPQVEDRLQCYSQHEKMKGFRHVLQGEPMRDYMLQPAFKQGIGLLAKYGFTYDILVFPDQLPFVETFVSAFPNQPFVIDHLAKPYIKDQSIDTWKQQMQAIARHPNVYCKVSGMVTEADWQRWKKEDFRPYLDVVTEAFGIDRLLYGSDWPVCLVAASYAQMLDIVTTYFASCSPAEQALFFGGNACRFYHLK